MPIPIRNLNYVHHLVAIYVIPAFVNVTLFVFPYSETQVADTIHTCTLGGKVSCIMILTYM